MELQLISATALTLLLSVVGHSADGAAFLCPAFDGDYEKEVKLLRAAPHGARRIGRRRLEITWEGGKRVFSDAPPYDEPLAGIRWVYCGFDPRLRMHLVFKSEGSLFTGTILDDKTGSLLPGGQKVLFSPDHDYYLTFEMEDGDVTEILKLYRRSGELLWSGHNGLTAQDGSLLATFRDLRWSAPDTVQTVVVPSHTEPLTTTLAARGDGTWRWDPLPSRIDGLSVDPGHAASVKR